MLLSIIRFFKGTVSFRVTGKSPERFLNLAAQRGIPLWNARPVAKGIEAEMSVADYKKVRSVARKAGVTTRMLSKRGLPFITARYKNRYGLLVGAAAGIALLIVLSNFIWTIDVKSTENVSEKQLLQILSDSGMHIGAYKYAVDTGYARRNVLLHMEEIGWLSVNINGSHADVEVKEKTEKPALDPNAAPCNIKAKTDGVITKITAANGIPEVKTGSGVAKGDLLVSGVSLTQQNTVRYVRANAEVMADVTAQKDLKIPKNDIYDSISENKIDRRRLNLLGFELPCSLSFGGFDEAAFSESRENVSLNDRLLPLGFVTESEHGLTRQTITRDKASARAVFNTSLLLYELFEQGGGQRVSRSVTVTEEGDGFYCHTDYVFNVNIAESVDFSVEE